MSDGPRRRGAKALSDRDWIFGSRPRRRLLEAVVAPRPPKDGWTRPQLANKAGVVANGGADAQIDGLVRLGLLELSGEEQRTWTATKPRTDLAKALRRVLTLLSDSPDDPRPTSAASPSAATAIAAALLRAERAVRAGRSELGSSAADELLTLLAQARAQVDSAM